MTQETSTHSWFAERISAYLTDGLNPMERSEFESHTGYCPQCAAKLAEAKLEDETLRGLFEKIGPAGDFEDRVIRRLRTTGQRKFALPRTIRLHPMVMRAAGAAAAIIVLGGLGYTATQMIQGNRARVGMASNIQQLAAAPLERFIDVNAIMAAGQKLIPERGHRADRPEVFANPYVDAHALGSGYAIAKDLQPAFAVGGDINHRKEGQNPLLSDGIPLPTNGPDNKRDLSGLGKQPASSVPPIAMGYSYQDQLNAPAPGQAAFFKPGSASTPELPAISAGTPVESKSVEVVAPAESTAQLEQKQFAMAMDRERNTLDDKSKENAIATNTPPPPAVEASASNRQIIRHGEMSFEVDSFDSAFMQITKIAAEESGFISDSDSEKLANGKMSGTITVRVPPDHLDTLTLKLRALGDLKGQKITSEDVTKQYTDMESELRAATAMENRLLEIIKTGNGTVKDLLAAEREVGVWREKVEQVTGEINYFNNLVSLSTLQITMTERDIRQAALASEREAVDMGIETEDVEKARTDAMRTLDAAKARIIQADLKKLDAGQLAATIRAEVSPDAAGPVVDHFKQLGRVARLNIDRQQTVADGTTVPVGVKVERLDTQLQISLYNLANVAPRRTTNVSIACPDVETAYHAIINNVAAVGGRVVDSSLNRIKPEQTDGVISIESPRDKADTVLANVRALGEVMHLTVTENPDAANVTGAKEGFAVTLASMATVAPREAIVSTLMPGGKMADAYRAMRAVVQSVHGNITTAQLQEQMSQSDSASLVFDVGRDHQSEIETAITKSIGPTGRVISRQNTRSDDAEHTLDSKVQFNLAFISADTLQPREANTRVLAVADVSVAYSQILASAQQAEAKIVAAALDQSNPSNPSGQLDLIISRDRMDSVEKAVADARGGTISKSISRSADLNSTTDEKVELRLTLTDLNQLPPRQTTTMSVEVSDPESASSDLQAAALAAGGRILDQHLVKDDKYQANLVVEVPLAKGAEFIDQARGAGTVQTIERTENQAVPIADFTDSELNITLNAAGSIVGPDAGLWAGLRSGFSTSVRGLAYSLELVVIGICLALPWAAMVWLGWKMMSRFRRKSAAA